MKDIALDDLIQEDKKKAQENRKNRANAKKDKLKNKRLIKKGPAKDGKPNRQDNRPLKNKPIGKDNRNPKKFNKFNREENRKPKQNEAPKQDKPKKEKPVKQAKPDEPKQEKGRTLKVLGLHPDIKNEDLYKLFAAEGALEKCLIEQDNFGRNLPSAIVKYHSAETAKQAISNINNKKILNSVLTVQPYRNVRN